MGDRWFDPYLNRWIQPDTIVSGPGKPQKLNRYSYVLNNPVEYVDPTGHIECSDWNDYGQCSEHPAPPAPSPRLPSELPPQTADNPADQAKLNEIVETYNAVVELVGHAFTPYELWALIAQAEFGNLFYSYTKFRQGGVDANAAEYYYFCGTDGCSNSELVVYLSQFQVWWDKSPIDFVGAGAAGYERLLESAFNSTVDPNNPLDYDAPWTYAYTVEGTTEFNKLNKGYPAYNGSWEYYAGSSRSDDVWVAIRYVDGFELRWALIVTPNQKAVFCGGDCLQ